MSEEKKLIYEFNRGSQEALCQIYQVYKKELYGLAVSLLRNTTEAEDALQDVFVSFAKMSGRLKLKGSLKNYLLTSIANWARDHWRRGCKEDLPDEQLAATVECELSGEKYAILTEEYRILQEALSKIKYEQREIIVLHLHHDMTFREIACAQGVSINTVQSRYRYGMEKLSVLLKEGFDNEQLQTNRRLGSAKQARA